VALSALTTLILAADGSGRGDNPSEGGGVLIVVIIALFVAAAAATGLWLVSRRRGRS
jgi:hypothetical protein